MEIRDLASIALGGIMIAALVWDLVRRRIPNALVIAGLVLGAGVRFLVSDASVIQGLLGAGLALALTFPLFALRAMGGGDVKLFTVAGMFLGPMGFFLVVASFAAGARLGWKLYDTARTPFTKGIGRGVGMMWGALLVSNMFGDRISYANLGVVVWTITGFAFAMYMKEERERVAEAFEVVPAEPELTLAPESEPALPEPVLRSR